MMKIIIKNFISDRFAHIFIIGALVLQLSCETLIKEDKYSDPLIFPYMEIDIATLQQGYLDGDFTITEVVSAYLGRIEAIDRNGPSLSSIITVNPDALDIAAKWYPPTSQ